MFSLQNITQSPRDLIGLAGLMATGLVVGGITLAQTMNLAACPLCILQRMLYMLIAVEALLAWLLFEKSTPRNTLIFLLSVTAATGAFIAGYQTWLQRFAQGVSCTADQPWWELFVDWAGSHYPLLFEATGLCSEAGWKFLKLSIAEWSLIAFSTLSAINAFAACRLLSRKVT